MTEKTTVLIIGGGATGIGVLRDLSLRGINALLVEKGDLMNGTSSRYHGLLHSGGRYAVKDVAAAKECIDENKILRRIGKSCVEPTEGMFVRLEGDDAEYEKLWTAGCEKSGIDAREISPAEARILEPRLTEKIVSAYLVPDAAIDGFRMAWQNIDSAMHYGGRFKTYAEVTQILRQNGKICGAKIFDLHSGENIDVECEIIVNAAGPWAGKIAALAGLEASVQPDKGALIVFNNRLVSRVVNRLHKSSDGDIFVPHGSATILGTTSASIDDPDDTRVTRAEVERLLSIGEETIENLRDYRILRAFAGSRPLYTPKGAEKGRGASRGFAVIDHEAEGLAGMITIVGGKFTTYRLMAEKMCDKICEKLGVNAPCRTAEEPLTEEPTDEEKKAARKYFPAYGVERAAERLGRERFKKVAARLKENPEDRKLICECENVTRAEAAEIAAEKTVFSLSDIRRRTRIGMGTCQGNFCTMRAAALLAECGTAAEKDESTAQMKNFVRERFKGVRPVLFGRTLREAEMTRAIYALSFHITDTTESGGKT